MYLIVLFYVPVLSLYLFSFVVMLVTQRRLNAGLRQTQEARRNIIKRENRYVIS